jgi:hypothetical protein
MSAMTVSPIAKPPTFGAWRVHRGAEDDEHEEERRDRLERDPFSERDVERQRLAAEPCAQRGFVREDPQERVRRERRARGAARR